MLDTSLSKEGFVQTPSNPPAYAPVILHKNVIAGVSSDHGVPDESNNCIVGPTIHPTTGASSYVGQDKRSTPATRQEDNGRSGGSSDGANNTGSAIGYHSNHTWFILYSGMFSYEVILQCM